MSLVNKNINEIDQDIAVKLCGVCGLSKDKPQECQKVEGRILQNEEMREKFREEDERNCVMTNEVKDLVIVMRISERESERY
jgi:hypothetical protein